jgi:hypothetical protein
MSSKSELPEPNDVLYRIKRGLAGYISYLAACEMNEAFSEYVLYEPILRILTARGYAVHSEVLCPGIQQPKTGDKKRLDFVACGHGLTCAIEVKWARNKKIMIEGDLEKLSACLAAAHNVMDQQVEEALNAFGIDKATCHNGWGLALDRVYDEVIMALRSASQLIRGSLDTAK